MDAGSWMHSGFVLSLLFYYPAFLAKSLKPDIDWFSIIYPFEPLGKIFDCGTKWEDIPLLRAHLNSFLN